NKIAALHSRSFERHRFIPAQKRANTRYHLTRAERLRDVIIGADLQSYHPIRLFVASRQNEHGRTRKSVDTAQLTADLQAIESGKHQVQDDQVRGIAPCFGESNGSIGGVVDPEALFFEIVFQQSDKIVVIFDDQNLLYHDT